MALEGLRYWDLLRWGTAQDVLKADFYGAPFPGAINMRKKGGVTDQNGRWYVISRNFRNPEDNRWPIPQSEQDINPNLR
ncbi:MAG: RagB/SusD family nutrient uptake outer membrane protein [Bacteroidetes bacterium]|nr:RagB/SusD family nutrient uptake outer membrane protein [Bacteroidota bacterium]MCL6102403.1 RagB/SusD family nutrient uptake outer membrane protein [Bacteroidota bacterium]